MNRRRFLQQSSLAAVGSMLIPSFLKADEFSLFAPSDKVLVIVQLSGGNDGLNTVVPFGNDLYYKLRPTLAVAKDKVLKISDELGFNPALEKLRNLYDDGLLSVVNSVGYPNPDRSHFRSMDIWHTASNSNEYLSSGWLGRYLDSQCNQSCQPYEAIEVDDTLSLVLKGEKLKGLAMQNPQKFYKSVENPLFQKIAKSKPAEHANENVAYLYKTMAETVSSADYIYQQAQTQKSKGDYPQGQLGKRLKTIADLIISGTKTKIYYVSMSGFDTHARQQPQQERLLKEYADSVFAFMQDMKTYNKTNDVCLMTFSEFGRRVAQNASNGTDHGTANNLFVIGGKIKKAGFFNAAPDLTNLDNGDLNYQIDFRDIYADLLKNWLQADDKLILQQSFKGIGLV